MMVVSPSGDKGRAGINSVHELEPQHAAVEAEGALKVGDLEVDAPDPDLGMQGAGGGRRAHADTLSRLPRIFNPSGMPDFESPDPPGSANRGTPRPPSRGAPRCWLPGTRE